MECSKCGGTDFRAGPDVIEKAAEESIQGADLESLAVTCPKCRAKVYESTGTEDAGDGRVRFFYICSRGHNFDRIF